MRRMSTITERRAAGQARTRDSGTAQAASRYRITLRGRLSGRFETGFDGMAPEPGHNETVLVGDTRDQATYTGCSKGPPEPESPQPRLTVMDVGWPRMCPTGRRARDCRCRRRASGPRGGPRSHRAGTGAGEPAPPARAGRSGPPGILALTPAAGPAPGRPGRWRTRSRRPARARAATGTGRAPGLPATAPRPATRLPRR